MDNAQPKNPDMSIHWDDAKMVTYFSNVLNVQSNREQFDLFFGTNKTWNADGSNTLQVELNSRVLISPHCAKRLHTLLGNVLKGYEEQYGKLEINQ